MTDVRGLTSRERSAYQSLRDRGHDHDTAREAALEGVDARDLRLEPITYQGHDDGEWCQSVEFREGEHVCAETGAVLKEFYHD